MYVHECTYSDAGLMSVLQLPVVSLHWKHSKFPISRYRIKDLVSTFACFTYRGCSPVSGVVNSSNVTFSDDVSGILGLGFPRLSNIFKSLSTGQLLLFSHAEVT